MKTAKILLITLLGLFTLFLTARCYSQNNDYKTEGSFSLEYLQECGFKDYKKTIYIQKGGVIEYIVTDSAEKIIRAKAKGNLSKSEIEDLKKIILNNDFFGLKRDLSVDKCYDAPSYNLIIKIDDKYNQAGGYCIGNKSFLNITAELDKLVNRIEK